ncbi:hypothetical protein KEM54_006547 [Ascosphaera aggregata]|nr:hypothetical protein KEM54_006547 [Ascosphaera aggregata]
MASPSHEFVADEDEYIARLLADDARRSSLRYASVGVGAFLSTRRPASSLKPNTRFLRNIIRDTDSHNANLKHRNLQGHTHHRLHDRKSHDYYARSASQDPHSISRNRQHGSSSDIRQSEKYSDSGQPLERQKRRHHSSHHYSSHETQHKRHHHSASKYRLQQYAEPDVSVASNEQRLLNHRSLKHRSGSHASASSSDSDLQQLHDHDERRRELGLDRQTTVQPSTIRCDSPADEPSDHSDDFIGPIPASDDLKPPSVTSRGRGITASNRQTSIDDHFAPDYDPRTEFS